MGARRLAVTAAWLPWHVWMCIWHAGKKRPGAGIVQGARLELFSATLEHACRPIMATPSHRAICLSSHSEGTLLPGSIGHAAVCCTVHPLARWDAKPGTSSMNSQRIAHLLAQGACVLGQIQYAHSSGESPRPRARPYVRPQNSERVVQLLLRTSRSRAIWGRS
jgi:hypothetical protein